MRVPTTRRLQNSPDLYWLQEIWRVLDTAFKTDYLVVPLSINGPFPMALVSIKIYWNTPLASPCVGPN